MKETSESSTASVKGNQVAGDSKIMMVQITNDHAGPKLLCPICNKALVSLNGYVKHLKKHDPPGGFLCKLCDNRFCSDDLLKKHRQESHSTLACRICHETFSIVEEYREHIRILHNGIDRKMSICSKCNVEFKTKEALKRHESTNCGRIKPHKCDECEMAFYTIYNLREHKKIHLGEKKFCCSYCGKSFLQKGRLLCHERSHTGEKPYKCDICGKSFAHRESFVTHSSIHTGVKLVECKCCGARFSCHSNLIKHRRSRKDTCGLPIYNRSRETKVRTGRSRIPASIMSSEIRISNASKVIVSPGIQKAVKSDKTEDFTKLHTNKSVNALEYNEELNGNVEKQTSASNAIDDDCDDADVDPLDNENNDENKSEHKLPEPKLEIVEKDENQRNHNMADIRRQEPIKEEGINFTENFNLLNAESCNNFEGIKMEELNLNRIEIKNEIETIQFSDAIQECTLVIQDVRKQYPQLKKNDTVKLSYNNDSPPVKERKSRKIKRQVTRNIAGNNSSKSHSSKPSRRLYQSELKERMKLIKQDKTYECVECIKVYHIRKPYETHLRQYHQKTDEELKSIFKDENAEVLDEMVYKCPYCPKVYLLKKRLQSHKILHGTDGSLIHKCPCYCIKFFSTRDEAFEHAKVEHKDLIYCSICDKFKSTPDGLKNHMAKHAPEKKKRCVKRNLVCDKCAKKFANRTSLYDHTRSDCGRNPIYQCDVCEKRFTSAGILKTHKLLHRDEAPHQCEQCGKTFKIKAQYIAHMKIKHTNYKPFKCHLCPKEYPYRESLLTHMTIHTGFKRFACDSCGKRFTCISNLQAHRKVNSDTCGLLPLNAKASQYMGVQKGVLLVGTKPDAGLE